MKTISNCCCICFNESEELQSILGEGNDGITFLRKLDYISPELKWLNTFSICNHCITQLNESYKFKRLCRKNEVLRRIKLKSLENSSNITINEDTTNDIDDNDCTSIKENFTCYHCCENFDTKKLLEAHIIIHSANSKKHTRKRQNPKFVCQICGDKFSLLKNLVKHCKKSHFMCDKDMKPYQCDTCPDKFTTSSLLNQHRKRHSTTRQFVCTTCGKAFARKIDLERHETIHNNIRNHHCNECDKSFNNLPHLRTHIYVVHTDKRNWKYTCPVCLKKIAMKSHYNDHLKRHDGQKEFKCNFCDKTFASNNELKKHVKTHSKFAGFKCQLCGKCYQNRRNLVNHMVKRHNVCDEAESEKGFICHICPRRYFDDKRLQRHILTH